LNTENPFVANTLIHWIRDFVNRFDIDGIRIDTVPEVPKWFWDKFGQSSGVFAIGEVFDNRLEYVADYQNHLDSLLNYPIFFAMKDAFQHGQSMKQIETAFLEVNKHFKDPSVLGVFVNNHDNSRFLHNSPSVKNFMNSIAFSILSSKLIFHK
jgi:alpha-amylase